MKPTANMRNLALLRSQLRKVGRCSVPDRAPPQRAPEAWSRTRKPVLILGQKRQIGLEASCKAPR